MKISGQEEKVVRQVQTLIELSYTRDQASSLLQRKHLNETFHEVQLHSPSKSLTELDW